MGEFELIRQYFAAAACARPGGGVALGIGDDCALLTLGPGEQMAVSTDTLVSGVHFPQDPPAQSLAQRALAVTVSDLAAMGAEPLGFTLALTLADVSAGWLQDFAQGLDQMAQRCGIRLVGGDTTRGPLSLTVTVFGKVPSGAALTRSGARPGDVLCVGGTLGDAAGALPLVLGQRTASPEQAQVLLGQYWQPSAQIELGLALRGRASAALDISDGLLADCGHIASASGVALRIERSRIPLSDALRAFVGPEAAMAAALSGGDDYRLAFTLPPRHVQPLLDAGLPLTVIGQVLAGEGVSLVDEQGSDITPAVRGYQHFQERP